MQLDGCVVVDHAGRGGWQGPCPPSPQFPKKKKKKNYEVEFFFFFFLKNKNLGYWPLPNLFFGHWPLPIRISDSVPEAMAASSTMS
jgi:hypothetical protein